MSARRNLEKINDGINKALLNPAVQRQLSVADIPGKPMSLARRAAFVLDGWIFWPQVTMLVNGKKIRVDCLAFNGRRWVVLEFDGFLHGRNPEQKKWDEKRDLSLGIEVLRFTQAEILSGHIVDLIRQKLAIAA